jgi:hypothetical protein
MISQMKQAWICWVVFALILGSIFHELLTGIARVRGIGSYPRDKTPRGYRLVLLAKGTLAALIAAIALVFSI